MPILCSLGIHDPYHPSKEQQPLFGYSRYAPNWLSFCCRCGKDYMLGNMFWTMIDKQRCEMNALTARELKYGQSSR